MEKGRTRQLQQRTFLNFRTNHAMAGPFSFSDRHFSREMGTILLKNWQELAQKNSCG